MSSGIGKAKIRIPRSIQAGDTVEVKALIRHPMETGLRKNKKTKEKIPAHYIDEVTVEFRNETVLVADWGAAVAKDPFFSFFLQVDGPGVLKITWKDNKGEVYSKTTEVTVK
ncbi:MAG: thiosulfate oxidation carrier complex protein SoxZ [Magnetococcales bacterium]|nr:thiosulfate oxidation carrier complex protein SoxZ [Magnetococcales bacterium]